MTLDEFKLGAMAAFMRLDNDDALSRGLKNPDPFETLSIEMQVTSQDSNAAHVALVLKRGDEPIGDVTGTLHFGKEFGISGLEFDYYYGPAKDYALPMFHRIILGMQMMGAGFIASADLLDDKSAVFFNKLKFEFLGISKSHFQRSIPNQRMATLRRKFRMTKPRSIGIPKKLQTPVSGLVGENYPDMDIHAIAVLPLKKHGIRNRVFRALGLKSHSRIDALNTPPKPLILG